MSWAPRKKAFILERGISFDEEYEGISKSKVKISKNYRFQKLARTHL